MLELKKQDNRLFDMNVGSGNNEHGRLKRWAFFTTPRSRRSLSLGFLSSAVN
jgi:hypothetical protein